MRLSTMPFATKRNDPAEEVSQNAKLLIRAGYIHKEMAGAYTLLPLGLRVVEKIKEIVRREMNAIGGNELLMTTLQRQNVWEQTNRWDSSKIDIWFKTKLKNNQELGLAWSHEEPIVEMLKSHVHSYRDLPVLVYQFQTKLRNETRAKSGIMRGREFIMKDLYSVFANEQEHQVFYDSVKTAYMSIFTKLGIGDITYLTFASGGEFTEFSHEFQTLTALGEDTIYLSRAKGIAINKEVLSDKILEKLSLSRESLEEHKSSEVGNIFSFGDSKTKQMGLVFSDKDGQSQAAVLGSYGIGITRLLGVLAENGADKKGLVWPEPVAPFQVSLIVLGGGKVREEAERLYELLQKEGVEVLLDDREISAGEKFSDSDLLGLPYRLVVSEKSLQAGGAELKLRVNDKTEVAPFNKVISKLF